MVTATIKGAVKGPKSKTGPQVLYRPVEMYKKDGVLTEYHRGTLTYFKIREMRKDPTIAMVRQLIVAPALLSPWSFEERKGAAAGSAEFVEKQLDEMRAYLIRTCLFGCIDYGWQAFEKVFRKDEDDRVVLAKMKALLPDFTDILIEANTGAFRGLRERNTWTGEFTKLDIKKSFVHSFDVEGTYWYGHSYMANAEDAYDEWKTANEANVRYDTKIAGSHWVIHYPIGTSRVQGVEKDNEIIAQEILGALQSSGGIAVPKKLEAFINELDNETPNAWEIELISDRGATQTGFLDRMTYLDKLKVRAFGFPERSILEGKYGTKAEASTHADFAVTNILLRTADLIRDLNWHLVDQLVMANYGADKRGTVRIIPGSLGSDNKDFLREIYIKLLDDERGFAAEFSKMDLQTLRKLLLVPTDSQSDEETSIFEKALEKLEEKAEKPDQPPPFMQGDENGVLNEDGSGNGVRLPQHRQVGRPNESWGSDGDPGEGRMGDSAGGLPNRRSAQGRPIPDSTGDNIEDDS